MFGSVCLRLQSDALNYLSQINGLLSAEKVAILRVISLMVHFDW